MTNHEIKYVSCLRFCFIYERSCTVHLKSAVRIHRKKRNEARAKDTNDLAKL